MLSELDISLGDHGEDHLIEGYRKRYRASRSAINVSLREDYSFALKRGRATHLLHSYPAKLLPIIPALFVRSNAISDRSSSVFDPFCGSGTVLVESILAGREAVGIDSNPLARLIAKVKTTSLDRSLVKKELSLLKRRRSKGDVPDVTNLEYWYQKEKILQLSTLKAAIDQCIHPDIRDLFLVCFSTCVRKLSLADPTISVPVKLNRDTGVFSDAKRQSVRKHLAWVRDTAPISLFCDVVSKALEQLASLDLTSGLRSNAYVLLGDSRSIVDVRAAATCPRSPVSLVVSSPPYGGAQKYIRSSSLSLGWLGLTSTEPLRDLERRTIGREHYGKLEYQSCLKTGIKSADRFVSGIHKENPLRAHISANYLIEMRASLANSCSILARGGSFVLVVGNTTVLGREFEINKYMREMLVELGLCVDFELVDRIPSRGLITSRRGGSSAIMEEHILVFSK